MGSYEFLAGSYDALTLDVDYPRWADYVEDHFRRLKRPVETVLDLACGTGSLTYELSGRGYTLTGVDLSADMLSLAEEKCRGLENRPQFFCQGMEALRLPGRVDACVCCLDSVNYVLQPQKLRRAFRRVYEHLNPGGVFFFDINSASKLRGLDGQVFLDESDDVYCVWRAEFDPDENICYYGMDLFQRAGGLWRRSFEEHAEYAYEAEDLESWLTGAGFSRVCVYGDRVLKVPEPKAQRIYFAAVKEKL